MLRRMGIQDRGLHYCTDSDKEDLIFTCARREGRGTKIVMDSVMIHLEFELTVDPTMGCVYHSNDHFL